MAGVETDEVTNLIELAGVAVSLVLGIAALVVALRGNGKARNANDLAAEANQIARESSTTAENAHSLAQRIDDRATEPHDVEWSMGWVDAHHYFLRNEGIDTAHDVRYIVRFPSGSLREDRGIDLGPWDDVLIGWEVATERPHLIGAEVALRITWRSAQGNPFRETITFAGENVARNSRGVG